MTVYQLNITNLYNGSTTFESFEGTEEQARDLAANRSFSIMGAPKLVDILFGGMVCATYKDGQLVPTQEEELDLDGLVEGLSGQEVNELIDEALEAVGQDPHVNPLEARWEAFEAKHELTPSLKQSAILKLAEAPQPGDTFTIPAMGGGKDSQDVYLYVVEKVAGDTILATSTLVQKLSKGREVYNPAKAVWVALPLWEARVKEMALDNLISL